MNKKIECLKNEIGTELRKLRAKKNLSRTAVIKGINNKNIDVNLNIMTLIRYENGATTQNLDKLIILLDFYDIDVFIFFNNIYENMYS